MSGILFGVRALFVNLMVFSTLTFQMQAQGTPQNVVLLKFPYPYQAMLAIDSDADHVTLRKFNLVHQFLNTTKRTPLGFGLGLDVSDSFFFYNGSDLRGPIDVNNTPIQDEMTFYKGVSHQIKDGNMILHYLRSGWVETFHSMGDFSRINEHETLFRRSLAEYAIDHLLRTGIRVSSFTDHGNESNVDNFGSYRVRRFFHYQKGDSALSPYYISDLVKKNGVKFLWSDEYCSQYSYPSMLYPIQLRDGTSIWGYKRFTGALYRLQKHHTRHKHGLYDWSNLWNPYHLPEQLSQGRLNDLVHTHGYTIIATHLEGNADQGPLSTSAKEALQHLAQMQKTGKILVARTSRLLQYNLVQQFLRYNVSYRNGITRINIRRVQDPVNGLYIPEIKELSGITFQVPNSNFSIITLNGVPILDTQLVYTSHTIGFPWYKSDTTDYTVWTNTDLKRFIVTKPITISNTPKTGTEVVSSWIRVNRMIPIGLIYGVILGLIILMMSIKSNGRR